MTWNTSVTTSGDIYYEDETDKVSLLNLENKKHILTHTGQRALPLIHRRRHRLRQRYRDVRK